MLKVRGPTTACRSSSSMSSPARAAPSIYKSHDWRNIWRCITFNARGYPPSEIPPSVDSYSQGHAAADIGAVFDGFGLKDCAYRRRVDGLSLDLAIRAPSSRSRALDHADQHRQRLRSEARRIRREHGGAGRARADQRHARARRALRRDADALSPPRRRTRPNTRISSISSPPIRRSASPTRCAACNRSARRSTRIRSASRR